MDGGTGAAAAAAAAKERDEGVPWKVPTVRRGKEVGEVPDPCLPAVLCSAYHFHFSDGREWAWVDVGGRGHGHGLLGRPNREVDRGGRRRPRPG